MADTSKAQKLAAARKKLKEYQQKSQKPSKIGSENEENLVICENLSNSTHSSTNDNFEIVNVPSESNSHLSALHNYFQENPNPITFKEPSSFFDSLSTYNPNLNINETTIKSLNDDNDLNTTRNSTVISNSDALQTKSSESNERLSVSLDDAKILSEYIENSKHKEVDLMVLNDQENVNYEDSQNKFFETAEQKISEHSFEVCDNFNSSAESLRQLSSQITELIKDDVVQLQEMNETDNKNEELTFLLEQERLKSKKLQLQVQEYQNKVIQLDCDFRRSKTEWENKVSRETGPLQEQLQCHAQTLGILVGEKTELSTALSQSQLVLQQKINDCEELQGRLKTSRSRVADLEKELQTLKLEKDNFKKTHNCKEETERFQKEFQHVQEKNEEIAQDLLEAREKLNVKVNENLTLQREVQELTHQLSLAQVKIQQITVGENIQTESQIEILNQQKLALEKQIVELNQALKSTTNERDQASVQYQHYVQQLNGQTDALARQLESITLENETLSKREQNLVQHISELERHLQNIQDDHLNFASGRAIPSDQKKELESALTTIHNLQSEKDELENNYQQLLADKGDLLQELKTKKLLIEDLESQLDRLQSNQPDSAKLLAAMESDKIAASRAVTQNSELKQQLEEMQQAFVKMSNDKLDLTERLTSEEFQNKELTEKLNQVQHQLHTLSEALRIKDNELTNIREANQSKQILVQDQLGDRLRHYEAQYSTVQAIQNELKESQQKIQHLEIENEQLKRLKDSNQSEVQKIVESSGNDVNMPETETPTISENYRDKQSDLDLKTLDKEIAMKHLEEKFTRTMQDIANLSEEKQRLEHIVTQLQYETETIGEYIALYQHQRGILKQRTQEKDEQLKRLAEDREKVRNKLDSLNGLVQKLVIEKGNLSPDFFKEHEHLKNNDLCSEHAKIQEKINKVIPTNQPNDAEPTKNVNNNLSTETAEEIIALLAEIKSSNLIQPSENSENFHPCSWCSGQLITV